MITARSFQQQPLSTVSGQASGSTASTIFTAMITAVAGVSAMTPTWPQLAVPAAVFAGIELQVRLVEEPYLRSTHGAAYTGYTARTGRFLPGLGRVSPPARA